MDFVREHKTLITVVAVIAILYLISRTQTYAMTMARLQYNWATMGMVSKVVVALIIIAVLYYAYSYYSSNRSAF